MNLRITTRWLFSRTVRQAVDMSRQVRNILAAQRDVISADAVAVLESALAEVHALLLQTSERKPLLEQMSKLEKVANQHLKPYPHAGWRENVEVFLVAVALALGIRTFFLQPFKIPTGSMQPTLYGIHQIAPEAGRWAQPDLVIPGFVSRFVDSWVHGVTYHHQVAKSGGRLTAASPPKKFLLFNLYQKFRVGPDEYTEWFPPDSLLTRAGLASPDLQGFNPREFQPGEDILKLSVRSGDYLFVDRLTYNFRPPKRGEIIVFETKGITQLPQDQFYIKRLTVLGNERVRIGDDRHLVINGTNRLDASTPHFENVYSFDPQQSPAESRFSGHVNLGTSGRQLGKLFPDGSAEVTTRPHHYMVMGDNTLNSSDSRDWGDFSRTNVIGRSWLVYWPISERFGWSSVRH
jgi:signal peptidase I